MYKAFLISQTGSLNRKEEIIPERGNERGINEDVLTEGVKAIHKELLYNFNFSLVIWLLYQ
jgi:hypothetical protein